MRLAYLFFGLNHGEGSNRPSPLHKMNYYNGRWKAEIIGRIIASSFNVVWFLIGLLAAKIIGI